MQTMKIILSDQEKNGKVTEFKYLGQTTHHNNNTNDEKIYTRVIEACGYLG